MGYTIDQTGHSAATLRIIHSVNLSGKVLQGDRDHRLSGFSTSEIFGDSVGVEQLQP